MAFVQKASNYTNTTTPASLTATFGAGTTAGNLIVGTVTVGNTNAITAAQITSGAGTSIIIDSDPEVTGPYNTATFYIKNISGAVTTVTFTPTTAADPYGIQIQEVSGLDTVSPLDQHSLALNVYNGATPSVINTPSVTTGANGEYIYTTAMDTTDGFISVNSAGGSVGAFTLRNNDTVTQIGSDASSIQTTAGAINGTFTAAGGGITNHYSTGIVTFKVAAGSAPIGKYPSTLLLPPSRKMVGWRGLTKLRAFPSAAGATVAMSGLATIQVKASAAATSQLAAAGRSTIQVKALAAATGSVPVTGRATMMIKAAAGSRAATAMSGRATVQTKAAAAPTFAAAIAGRATVMLKSAAAASGVVPLAARATVMVKAAGGISTGTFIALAGRCAVMVKASAAATGQAALAARATIQTKASAAATGAVGLAGRATIMVKAAGAISTGSFVALSGMCTAMFKAAGQQAGALAIAGHLTIQVKAQSASPVQPPGSGVFQLITSMARFYNPGASEID
jgi:hypothetical protein